MKKASMTILVLLVIGIGFYIGYQHAITKNVKLPSVIDGQSIDFQYRLISKPFDTYYQVSFDTTRRVFIFKGKGDLYTIMLCSHHTDGEELRFRHKDYPSRDNKFYEFSLSYSPEEKEEHILEMVGRHMGFTFELYSITTEFKYYAKTKNLHNTSPLPAGKYRKSITTEDSLYKFRNASVTDILNQFAHVYGVPVRHISTTESGIVYNVDLNIPSTMQESIQEIREKTGIEITTPIKVKTYNVLFK